MISIKEVYEELLDLGYRKQTENGHYSIWYKTQNKCIYALTLIETYDLLRTKGNLDVIFHNIPSHFYVNQENIHPLVLIYGSNANMRLGKYRNVAVINPYNGIFKANIKEDFFRADMLKFARDENLYIKSKQYNWARSGLLMPVENYTVVMTYLLAVVNILSFVFFRGDAINKQYGYSVSSPVYTWITYAFIHGGLVHLLCNCLGLLYIGKALEQYVGSVRFMVIYLCSAIGAAYFCIKYVPVASTVTTVGASGAICGLLGAGFATLFTIKKEYRGNLYLISLFTFLSTILAGTTRLNVNNECHAFGFVWGFVVMIALEVFTKNSNITSYADAHLAYGVKKIERMRRQNGFKYYGTY